MYIYIYIYIYIYVYIYIYIYIYIYGNHINFKPIHFSSYGNLKIIFETTLPHLAFSSFIFTSYNTCIQSLFVVKFYNFALKINLLL